MYRIDILLQLNNTRTVEKKHYAWQKDRLAAITIVPCLSPQSSLSFPIRKSYTVIRWIASPCSHFALRESVRKPPWERTYVRNKRKTGSVNLFPSTVQVVPIATRKLFLSAIKILYIYIQELTSLRLPTCPPDPPNRMDFRLF